MSSTPIMLVGIGLGAFGCMALVIAWMRHAHRAHVRERELHAPLLPDSTEHRLDAALRDAERGFTRCRLCGFENFKRFAFCTVCGDALAAVDGAGESHERKADAASKWARGSATTSTLGLSASASAPPPARGPKLEKKSSMEVVTALVPPSAPMRRAAVTQRQQRAMLRREWLRRADVAGNLFWYRDATVTTRSYTAPGYVLTLTVAGCSAEEYAAPTVLESSPSPLPSPRPTASTSNTPPASPLQNVPKAQRALELQQLTATLRLQLIESRAADPVWLPVAASAAVDAANMKHQQRVRATVALADRDFPTKYAHFVTASAALLEPIESGMLKLNVHRSDLFEDSIESFSIIPAACIHSAMRINFIDELGIDAGGVYREWFVMVNEMLADPANGVFRCVNPSEQTFYLNAHSHHDLGEHHLMYFFATGRFVGRALLEGNPLGFHLALPLLKIVLGIPVSFSDLEYFDPELYRNLLWIKDNDGVDALGLDFSVTERRGDGEMVTVDLIPNGRDIDVTDANKHEYLERRFRHVLFESVSSQLFVFLKGLYEVIPQELLMLFDPEEFDYLLCGSDEIDVDDWEKHTKYTENLYEHRAMIWFWELVREMPNEHRRRLLHFATGSSRVPIAGFSALTSYDGRLCPFTLQGVHVHESEYIASHACFNRLELPLYESRVKLEDVLYATLDTELFGFTTD